MKMKNVLKILAVTAFMGGALGDCTDPITLPSPLSQHAMRAPAPAHVPMPQVG